MAIKKEIDIVVNTAGAEKNLKKVSKATEDVGDKAKKTSASMETITGGAV